MATIEIKYSIGDEVEHFTGVHGMITAIFHRSNRNSYEMSFLDGDKPSSVTVEEYELSLCDSDNLGFKK